jgi:hypothetical protein
MAQITARRVMRVGGHFHQLIGARGLLSTWTPAGECRSAALDGSGVSAHRGQALTQRGLGGFEGGLIAG